MGPQPEAQAGSKAPPADAARRAPRVRPAARPRSASPRRSSPQRSAKPGPPTSSASPADSREASLLARDLHLRRRPAFAPEGSQADTRMVVIEPEGGTAGKYGYRREEDTPITPEGSDRAASQQLARETNRSNRTAPTSTLDRYSNGRRARGRVHPGRPAAAARKQPTDMHHPRLRGGLSAMSATGTMRRDVDELMFSFLRKHLSYANVVATLALVFTMSGGALAAQHYLISRRSQISPKVIKAMKGKNGQRGPQGAIGSARGTGRHGRCRRAGRTGPDRRHGPGRCRRRNGGHRPRRPSRAERPTGPRRKLPSARELRKDAPDGLYGNERKDLRIARRNRSEGVLRHRVDLGTHRRRDQGRGTLARRARRRASSRSGRVAKPPKKRRNSSRTSPSRQRAKAAKRSRDSRATARPNRMKRPAT